MTSILPYITFLLVQQRLDSLVCPPDHAGAEASVWIRAISHDHGGSVILILFSFLTYLYVRMYVRISLRIISSFHVRISLRIISSLQVHGQAAVDKILKVFGQVQAAQGSSPKPAVKFYADEEVSDIEDLVDSDDSGNEGSDDEGSEDEDRQIAAQWHGLFTDDVSWWLVGCYSFL